MNIIRNNRQEELRQNFLRPDSIDHVLQPAFPVMTITLVIVRPS